jgi:hypothetical protein
MDIDLLNHNRILNQLLLNFFPPDLFAEPLADDLDESAPIFFAF